MTRKTPYSILTAIILGQALASSVAKAECSCFSPQYHFDPLEQGVMSFRRDRLPRQIDSIEVCLWAGEESDGQSSGVLLSELPVEGKSGQSGYTFGLKKSWDVHGKEYVVAMPRIVNRRIVKSSVENSCQANANSCAIHFSYVLRKAWDVEVKPLAEGIEIAIELKNGKSAERIAPYGICPQGPNTHVSSVDEDLYAFKAHEDATLKLVVHQMAGGSSNRSFPIRVVEEDFKDRPKKTIDIREEVGKLIEQSQSTRAQRVVNRRIKEDWGIDDENRDSPRLVIRRLNYE